MRMSSKNSEMDPIQIPVRIGPLHAPIAPLLHKRILTISFMHDCIILYCQSTKGLRIGTGRPTTHDGPTPPCPWRHPTCHHLGTIADSPQRTGHLWPWPT
jgi:hypothetical protein